MNSDSRSFRGALLASLLALPLACSGDGSLPSDPGPDPTPDPTPQTGFIQVTTATTGSDLDPDGYTVSMDGNGDRSIGPNGVTTFSDVPEGQHQVAIAGLAANCAVNGANPASAAVTGGATAAVSFAVTCDALPIGSLEVTTTVTNNFDPDGYDVFVAALNRGEVDVEGDATFDDLPAGSQEVELRDIAPNCAVDGDNPASVTIPAGGTATHAFAVTCTNPPDGRIVYTGTAGGKFGIAVMNADGSAQMLILEADGVSRQVRRPRWSSDGKRIAFVMFDPSSTNAYREVYTINQAGGDLTQVTGLDGYADSPAWSPDGSKIAFESGSECCGGNLYTVNADGTSLMEVPRAGRLFHEESPDWSPDGSQIVFAGYEEDFLEPGIYLMDATGGAAVRISPEAPICAATAAPAWYDGIWWGRPVWSPDGSTILFARTHQCEPESVTNEQDLLSMNPDGTALVNLTNKPGWEVMPSWSPDGTRIVYDGGDWSIHVMNADGTASTPIIPPATVAVSDPDWGP